VRRRLAAALAVAAGLALASPLAAAAARTAAGARAYRGIDRAARVGWIKPADAKRYRTAVYLAERGARFGAPLRARVLESQLAQVSTLSGSYISPRALALFSQLRENVDYLASHRIPADGTDVTGPDGVVYRWFSGKGFEFHPLANFSKLDNLAAAKNLDATAQLADALLARAIPRAGGRLYWEYSFPYGSGRAPWASGLAQAVAAQALARASAVLGDDSLLAAAAKAYATIPGLVQSTTGGPWIRLYGFDHEVVLNAQLQTVVSLREYATRSGDARAQELADGLLAAARALFPRFDTGDWSRYELGGAYASRGYQEFVTDLIGKLAKQTQDPFWTATAARFVNYTYEPPVVTQPGEPEAVLAVPQPLDGYLDTVQIPIELSKRASLTVSVGGTILTYRRLPPGRRVIAWKAASELAPGTYPVTVRAVDFGGNHASYRLAPLTVLWDTEPPPVTASVDPSTNTLTWDADDPGTPWLALRVTLTDPAGVQPPQTIDLGQEAVSGTLELAVPPGTWSAVLEATNSAELTTAVELGTLSGTPAPQP
jgi:hypothetical protein